MFIFKMIRWHKKTFKNTTDTEQLEKVKEEINEYIKAFEEYTKAKGKRKKDACKRRMLEELIDVIIASINCTRYPEIRKKILVKMEINRHRTFKNNHHIGD